MHKPGALRDHLTNFNQFKRYLKCNNDTFLDAFVPDPNLTVDEQLLPFRARCPYCQYLPSKHGKYGIKI